METLGDDESVYQEFLPVPVQGVTGLVVDIGEHSAAAGFPFTERPEGGYAASKAFRPDDVVRPHMDESYELATGLIYGSAPTLDACLATVRSAAHLI